MAAAYRSASSHDPWCVPFSWQASVRRSFLSGYASWTRATFSKLSPTYQWKPVPISEVEPGRHDGGAGEHTEADEAVDAGVLSVGDQGWTAQPSAGAESHLGRDLVADEAD